jgi:hypothetical protein
MTTQADKTTASREYTVGRTCSWGAMPCEGTATLHDDEQPSLGHFCTSPMDVLGRDLPEGSRIRVTVEVLSETEWPDTCQIPWHNGPFYKHKSDYIPIPKKTP